MICVHVGSARLTRPRPLLLRCSTSIWHTRSKTRWLKDPHWKDQWTNDLRTHELSRPQHLSPNCGFNNVQPIQFFSDNLIHSLSRKMHGESVQFLNSQGTYYFYIRKCASTAMTSQRTYKRISLHAYVHDWALTGGMLRSYNCPIHMLYNRRGSTVLNSAET